MSKEVTMPRLSETMPHGKILVWYKKPDDLVNKGEIIAEVETDKANMEIEAVDSGILSEILVYEGETAKVGDPIAILNHEKEPQIQKKEIKKEEKPKAEKIEEFKETKEEMTPGKFEKLELKKKEEKPLEAKASLLARELAEQLNIDLSKIKGTGPEGQVKKSDIINAAENNGKKQEIQPEDTITGEKQPLTRIRSTIAKRMTYSKQNTPHFYVTVEVDADKLIEYYNNLRQKIDGITYNDIFIKAIALILKEYPKLNSSFKDDYVDLKKEINIGIALASENGLLVPVIHDPGNKSLNEIHNSTASIKSRVKNNKLKPEDMTGGTFTVSNMGMYGVKEFKAIINPPESAGLAIGSIMKTPVVRDCEVKAGNTVNISLSGDHRVMDGADGARFMKDLKNILENPEKIEQV